MVGSRPLESLPTPTSIPAIWRNPAYGFMLGSAIAKGRITSMELTAARAAPGVLAIVSAKEAGKLGKGKFNTVALLGGPDVDHYHQAIAVVVAETFEQARAASALIKVEYARGAGRFDLAEALKTAPLVGGSSGEGSSAPPVDRVGQFEQAFAAAPVKVDASYTTPDQSHMMMEPFASIAAWDGDELTLWTSNQMIDWGRTDLAKTLGMAEGENSLYVALRGRWFRWQAVVAGRRRHGRARCEGGGSRGQGRHDPADDAQQLHPPAGHAPTHSPRRRKRWDARRNRSRRADRATSPMASPRRR